MFFVRICCGVYVELELLLLSQQQDSGPHLDEYESLTRAEQLALDFNMNRPFERDGTIIEDDNNDPKIQFVQLLLLVFS